MKRALFLCLLPLPALAQTDDRGYLTAFLEDNLSGAGRQVVITGFEGALSSQARIAEITIADNDGIWLTLHDVVLDWNRSALLAGNVSVNELSAGEIIVARRPIGTEAAAKPEAGSFSLPDLPVSINIGRIAAERIQLGPDVLGQPVEGSLEAGLTLSGGIGDANLQLERRDDGPEGRITLTASYSNETRLLALDLSASEEAGGLVATALDLPGQPAATLQVHGTGPASDFIADVTLATDGQPRLTGRVVTKSGIGETGFAANLSGDVAPLFLPDYAEFFGNRVELLGSGTAYVDGRLNLSRVKVKAKALDLAGSLSLAANGNPNRFDLEGSLAQEDGTPVLLPFSASQPLRIQNGNVSVSYDKSMGEGWNANISAYGLQRDDFQASALSLSASGRITPDLFGATIAFNGEGLAPRDAATAQALGSFVAGDAVLFYQRGESGLAIPKLRLQGDDYRLSATGARVAGLAEALTLTGQVSAELQDLSRFAPLAKLPLQGSTTAKISGTLSPLTGAFDVTTTASGRDLRSGQPLLDGLLKGQPEISGHLRRDQTGTRLTDGKILGTAVEASVAGVVSSTASDLTAEMQLRDLAALGPGFGGTLQLNAQLKGPLNGAALTATATGQNMRVGNAEINKLLAGESRMNVDMMLRDGAVQINGATLKTAELSAEVSGQADGSRQQLTLDAKLRNLGVLVPDFPGPLTARGTVQRDSNGATVDITGKGPGGIDASIKGRIDPAGHDLMIRGKAQAALANAIITPRAIAGPLAFDLRLSGPLALSSLTGQITLNGGRLSDPSLAFAFDGISARADLSGGRARVSATLPLTTTGRLGVAGTIGLAAPHPAALGITVQGATLRDPDLYETLVNGELTLTGPLQGRPLLAGRVTLVETELRIPSTGFGGAAGLPELRHSHEPADVRATRARAGLLAGAAGSARGRQRDVALDVTISAPNRVFVRGRGLDAELGGEVRLLGSLAALAPAGAFNLIRGRLDLLGKRFEVQEALLQLEGDLVPFLRMVASTENDGITANVVIEGRADDPNVSFTAVPDMPEEEVLAQLLFGQDLQNLSPIQALQLANAVATLAGRGGQGVMGRLRQGIGVDNLDVKTTTEGGTELTAGKYIGKNAYTEVTVGQDGKSQINLNLDLTDSITLRGRADNDGQTGIGVFLERDY